MASKIETHDSSKMSWGDYFMGFAIMAATRSKDPNYQVGACIVNQDRRLVSTGYNGFPDGVREITQIDSKNEDSFPWNKEAKKEYVCHAELNAITNAKADLSGCILYVTRFPCSGCARLIIQSKIHKVYYITAEERNEKDTKINQIAKELFKFAGDQVALFNGLSVGSHAFAEMHELKNNLVQNMYAALRRNHEKQAD